jgi:hypothetical protein
MNESEIQEKIQIIMRQTDYSNEEARTQLEMHNFNIMKTISSFMNPKKREPEIVKQKSVNQEIYSQIRNYLDNGVSDKAKQRIYYEDYDRSKTTELEITTGPSNINGNSIHTIQEEEDNNENKVIDL